MICMLQQQLSHQTDAATGAACYNWQSFMSALLAIVRVFTNPSSLVGTRANAHICHFERTDQKGGEERNLNENNCTPSRTSCAICQFNSSYLIQEML